ncbi:TetR/AcrR family transcriptional regulator [Nocardioides kongjuensis]|uniref:AcrR family transcriptional regulator n=1 Tax=Nocardioides kongjuensis TaxID=349522 RepID=A0A852RU13_9ACTN|nr:TetR/AcrR family transcriptional regulator [Nocardioides kongjuensis]NYD32360.1 AcrR family transcriptional regulator [Nocardioides kongjuensis]
MSTDATTAGPVRRRGGPSKGDQREAAIVDATRRLLATKSVNELTVDAIAKAAGVSRTAFYFYFPTKQAVVADLLDGLWDRFGDSYGWLDTTGADRAALREHHRLVAEVWREHASILSCTTGPSLDYQPLLEWADRARARFVDGLAAKVLRDRAEGVAPGGVDAPALAQMVFDLRDARMRVVASADEAEVEQLLADLTEGVLRLLYGVVG